MCFKAFKGTFGKAETVCLGNTEDGSCAEIALQGATLLSYNIKTNNGLFNIIDGYADEDELIASKGARSWIMLPFANRIPDGKYKFNGAEYQLKPIAPRSQVIHGFASLMDYKILNLTADDKKAEVILELDGINPYKFEGYPFSLRIIVVYTLSKEKLNIKLEIWNTGEKAAPVASGWHPYFRTSEKGIEHLVFTLNAGKIIKLDKNYIPLPAEGAYADIRENPELNFNSYIEKEKRIINNRKLDNCYSDLAKNEDGFSSCSLEDTENGLEIIMYQKGGVTLAFSGDSLSQRKRKSVALEPMECLTNAFNREEFSDKISLAQGGKKEFEFGVRVNVNM